MAIPGAEAVQRLREMIAPLSDAPIHAECECDGGRTRERFEGSEQRLGEYFAFRARHRGQGHNFQTRRGQGFESEPRMRFACTCGWFFTGGAQQGADFFAFAKTHGFQARRNGRRKGHEVTGEIC